MPVGCLIDVTLTQPGLARLPAAAQEQLAARIARLGVRVESAKATKHKGGNVPVELCVASASELLDASAAARLFAGEAAVARRVRVYGLGDALLSDWRAVFRRLASACAGTVELCPTNELGCATGIVVEWLLGGYGDGCCALFGEGGLAATEQVAAALVVALKGRSFDLTGLPALRVAWETYGMPALPAHAAVAGHDIYYVESGVHVDGILKDPTNYEPLPPEALGSCRAIVLGKHSGRSSVVHELARLGLKDADDELVDRLLKRVRNEATSIGGLVSHARFEQLVRREMRAS